MMEIRAASTAARSWCHASLFQVADRGGKACAALVAFEPEEIGEASLAKPLFEVFRLLAWRPERMTALGPLLAPYQRCFSDMPPGSWIVENVGTRADQRRQGMVQLGAPGFSRMTQEL